MSVHVFLMCVCSVCPAAMSAPHQPDEVKESEPERRQPVSECGVCLEPFSHSNADKMPRLLPACSHSFCTACCKQLVKEGQAK